MLDRLREYRKSGAERQREMLNAYVDGELSPRERVRFEARLAEDPALREELMALRQLRTAVRMLPRARAPRNFTLDPAVYGKPAPATAYQLYPFARAATALTAFFFILAIALSLASPFAAQEPMMAEAPLEEAAEVAEMAVTEEAVEEEPAEEPAAELMMEAEVAEEAVEEEAEITARSVAEEEAPAGEAADAAPEEAPHAFGALAPEGTITPTVEEALPTAPPLATPAVAELPEQTVEADTAQSAAEVMDEQLPAEGEPTAVTDTAETQLVDEPGTFDELTTVELLAIVSGLLLLLLGLFTLALRRAIG